MEQNHPTNIASTLLIFVIVTALALIFLLTAAVIWLAHVLGSLSAALLLVGGVLAVISITLYTSTIRWQIKHCKDQIETIYQVATMARNGYQWIMRLISSITDLSGR